MIMKNHIYLYINESKKKTQIIRHKIYMCFLCVFVGYVSQF